MSTVLKQLKHDYQIKTRPTDAVVTAEPQRIAESKPATQLAVMSEDVQQDAIDIFTQGLEKFNIEKVIAAFIKKEFDKNGKPATARHFQATKKTKTCRLLFYFHTVFSIILFLLIKSLTVSYLTMQAQQYTQIMRLKSLSKIVTVIFTAMCWVNFKKLVQCLGTILRIYFV